MQLFFLLSICHIKQRQCLVRCQKYAGIDQYALHHLRFITICLYNRENEIFTKKKYISSMAGRRKSKNCRAPFVNPVPAQPTATLDTINLFEVYCWRVRLQSKWRNVCHPTKKPNGTNEKKHNNRNKNQQISVMPKNKLYNCCPNHIKRLYERVELNRIQCWLLSCAVQNLFASRPMGFYFSNSKFL